MVMLEMEAHKMAPWKMVPGRHQLQRLHPGLQLPLHQAKHVLNVLLHHMASEHTLRPFGLVMTMRACLGWVITVIWVL